MKRCKSKPFFYVSSEFVLTRFPLAALRLHVRFAGIWKYEVTFCEIPFCRLTGESTREVAHGPTAAQLSRDSPLTASRFRWT